MKTFKTYLIEILVVFIGILLAFTLENYRNNMENSEKKDLFFTQIQNEIYENRDSLKSVINALSSDMEVAIDARTALLNKDFTHKSLNKSIEVMLSKPYFNPSDQAYFTMINSNGFILFEDIRFKSKLSEIYKSYEDLKLFETMFDKYSSDYFVKYNMNHYNFVTNSPTENNYFTNLEFGNNLMSYLALISQYYNQLKLMLALNDDIIEYFEQNKIN